MSTLTSNPSFGVLARASHGGLRIAKETLSPTSMLLGRQVKAVSTTFLRNEIDNMASKHTVHAPFKLLKLPGEIRNKIYSAMLGVCEITVYHSRRSRDKKHNNKPTLSQPIAFLPAT